VAVTDEVRMAIYTEAMGDQPSRELTHLERAEYHADKAFELAHSNAPEHAQQSLVHSQLASVQLQLDALKRAEIDPELVRLARDGRDAIGADWPRGVLEALVAFIEYVEHAKG